MGRSKRKSPKELAGKLWAIKAKLDIGQEGMAERLKEIDDSVYPGLISRFEQGKVEPNLLLLLEYARLGKTTMEVLIDDSKKLK